MSTATHPASKLPPPSFSKLGPRMSLYTPPSHATGELIILCTWLGAARKHIDKYISAYLTIAPNAKILLIQSDVTSVTSSYPNQRKDIMPAVEVVRGVLSHTTKYPPNPKILIHTFSNGGPISATALLLALHTQISTPLPITGIIMDSGPAAGYYWKSYNAMVLSLPSGLLRSAGYVFVHGILLILFASVALGRYEYPEVLVRRTLLDERFVCDGGRGGNAKGRVCYLYSKADRMTDWEDVVGHADMAKEKGWDVGEVVFEGTPHCGHLVGNDGAYVGEMGRMWEGRAFAC
ncbi:indole-diterpene biosynthesis protein-like protein PaxU [Alternaria rosae]|uniref:indole-diterpene biosynthesis protein-like protein PaxU n=1 Tax=Alternaria rosae TaxID=1187941 RepID=UPI001E8DA8A5|nr:indole-diterpene biosynthesis protein-like protein PaxU [Alternaria rosae]KAH6881887.1 indole-diterpene biosynthesis protein-like protein PaxU [Alternaria rosae]